MPLFHHKVKAITTNSSEKIQIHFLHWQRKFQFFFWYRQVIRKRKILSKQLDLPLDQHDRENWGKSFGTIQKISPFDLWDNCHLYLRTFYKKHPDTINMHPNNKKMHPNNRKMHPNNMKMHPNNRKMHPNNMKMHPNNKKMQCIQTTWKCIWTT